ncbi:SurA N-terminal domain-containing protein [Desulfobacula sp.]|uniref:peptidylprolyl isomerase n=1 Tax=Desulfobacula sp. TaxID=2593537 RepID=UPI002621953F|nr:SurA N-terminal domain-containing protein [Desulfobacula sp.]
MLRYLRENTGNWIIKLFLGIIVIVFVFLGVGSFGSKRNDSIATINDKPITIKEYQQAYKTMVDQMRSRFGKNLNDDILKALNVKQQALDSLIDQKIILAEADKLDITVSDTELQQNLVSIKAFQKEGRFDLDQYKKVLNMNSLNPEIFEQLQIDSMRQQKIKDLVLSAVNVSDLEARDWYVFQNKKVAVNYLLFAPEAYADIHPDENQIKTFYTAHTDQYKSETKIQAVYLKFSPDEYKAAVNITDANIKEYYEQYPELFLTPEKVEARHILIKVGEDADEETVAQTQKRAQDIYEMAVKGQEFEQLAKQYSEGPSKDTGGYLGVFEKQSMVKPFADKAFAMKPDEISTPVRTQFGWHIIKVIARFDAATQTLAESSAKIKKELEQKELQNLAYYKAGEAFDAVIDGDDLEQVALIANKKILTTKEFTLAGEGLDMTDPAGFAKTAFELPLDDISDVIDLGGVYYLIKVFKKIDPVVQELDLVKDRVIKELTAKLQHERAKEAAQLTLAKAVDAQTLDLAGKDHSLTVKSTELFTRNATIEDVGSSPEFIRASFSLNETNKIYPETIETPAGFYLIGFKEQALPEESEISENFKRVKEEVTWRKQGESFQAWMKEVKKHYTINYDPEMLN